jgi:hypothetical protein
VMKNKGKLFENKKAFLFWLMAVLVLVVSFSLVFKKNFKQLFFFKYEEIDVRPLFKGPPGDPFGEGAFSSPIAAEHSGIALSPGEQGEIDFIFQKPISFDSFSLFFKGNLHSISSFLAEDFDVYCHDEQGNLKKIDVVKGNKSSVYQFYSSEELKTDAVKIVVYKAPANNMVAFGDLKFYRKERINFLSGLKIFLFEKRKTLPFYLFFSFFFYLFLVLPGYLLFDVFSKRIRLFRDNDAKVVFAPVLSLACLFIVALIYLLTGFKKALDLYGIFFIVAGFFFIKRRLYKKILAAKFPLLLISLFLLIVLFLQAQRDYLFNLPYIEKYLDKLEVIPLHSSYYGYHSDNTSQWRIAKLFLKKIPLSADIAEDYLMGFKPEEVLNRTPFFPLATMVILHLFGGSHFIYQRFLNVLAGLYYGAIYLLLKAFFPRRVAKIGSLLVLLNVPLTFLTANAELYFKYFSIYPVFLAIVLFLKQKDSRGMLIGLLCGLAFFIHPYTLPFSITLLLLFLLRYRMTRTFFKKTVPILLVLALLFSYWVLSPRIFGAKKNFDDYTYHFEELIKPQKDIVKVKLVNLLNLFIPVVVLESSPTKELSPKSILTAFEFLRYSLITNLSPLFILLLGYFWLKNFRRDLQKIVLALVPLLIFWLFYLRDYRWNNYGGAYFLIYPFVIPLLLAYVADKLLKKRLAIRLGTFFTYPIFMFWMLRMIGGVFVDREYIPSVVTIAKWALVLIFFGVSFWLLKLVARQNHFDD